ncbi:hypothetical protein P7K49_014953 [Saguinus oedipus]|uniref:Uncharacterized protein n=1 Tax=Saguinus oedipus TaxID=9490 RepID=A0ABQ9V7V6_SAGOE|nr:hypothetical protein P7K49_014953 [Saguinus oedipus]
MWLVARVQKQWWQKTRWRDRRRPFGEQTASGYSKEENHIFSCKDEKCLFPHLIPIIGKPLPNTGSSNPVAVGLESFVLKLGLFGVCFKLPWEMEGVYQEMGGVFQEVGGVFQEMGGVFQEMGGMFQEMKAVYQEMGGVFQEMEGVFQAQ